jgi:hypothetical protein
MQLLTASAIILGGLLASSTVADDGAPTTAPSVIQARPAPDTPTRVNFCCILSNASAADADAVKHQLRQVTQGLKPEQSFAFVFAQKSVALASSNDVVPANAENKQAASDWLDKLRPTDAIDPLPAIRQAFNMHPEVLYLLVDGDLRDSNAVREQIAKLDARHDVHLNVIVFRHFTDAGLAVLKAIAEDNGGKWRIIPADDAQK